MIKSFLILISFSILLFSSQQIILVVANDFNTSQAFLECYEGDKKVCKAEANIGKNGLGWGLGILKLKTNKSDPQKYEGDKKAPAGVFKLTHIFGYKNNANYKLPYLYSSKNLICVDDVDSNFYNQIIQRNGEEKSFEYMRRDDNQYKYGVTVEHNEQNMKGRGSCIFLHIQKAPKSATVGCTSMSEKDLKFIIHWLDEKKNPILIQIPKSSSKEILQLYPQLKASTLLL